VRVAKVVPAPTRFEFLLFQATAPVNIVLHSDGARTLVTLLARYQEDAGVASRVWHVRLDGP
jgi:hypothetical protein